MAEPTLHARLDEGLRLCQSGAFGEAARIYRELTEAYPDAPDAWNMLAVVLYQEGELNGAARAAARATALRPAIAPYWLTSGNIALAQRLYREARASFARAVDLDPAFAEAHYRLGLSFHQEGLFAQAVAAFEAALRLAPHVAEIHWTRGDALLADNKIEAAIAAYERAFTLDPDDRLDRRGCFECLAHLSIDRVPAFWQAEIERFFQRTDLDKGPYARLGLKVLRTKPAFREVLASGRGEDASTRVDPSFWSVLADPLFQALLRDCLITDAAFERFLTGLRARLLLDESARRSASLSFIALLALQCFMNEYVYAESVAETEAAERLARELQAPEGLRTERNDDALRSALVLACYRPIEDIAQIDALLAPRKDAPAIELLHQRSVVSVRAERALRPQIPSLSPIEDDVSRAVREMYETNPYPRWFVIDREPPIAVSDWVSREVPVPVAAISAAPRVLVAGCGTGHDAIWIAANIASSQVTAVDLSLSSLSYASRMALAFGLQNIDFHHGDILSLGRLAERFDMIASTGVLHHMREPLSGLRTLAGLLRPKGLMKLGFYSARARSSVNAARAIIADMNISPTAPAIRAFRQQVFAASPDSPLKELQYADDLYSLSMCRDLLFHIQEHQYTLPQIAGMLDECGLTFLGLSDLPQDTRGRFGRMFPQSAPTDIAAWEEYEKRHPDTFSRMFLFWCRAS